MKIFRLLLWFCLGFLLSAVPLLAFSATIYTVPVEGVSYTPSGGMVHTSRLGVSSPLYPGLNTSSSLSIPAGKGTQLMTIPAQISGNVPRIAGKVVGLARLGGPIGLGITLLPIFCEETGICQSSNPNQFAVNKYSSSPVPGVYRVVTATDHYNALDACTGERFSWCATAGDCDQIAVYNQTSTTFACSGRNMNQNEFKYYTGGVISPLPCPSGSVLTNGQCVSTTPTQAPPTEDDWTSALAKLTAAINRMASIIDGLQGLGESVPVDKPVLSPTSGTSSPTTTVNRDPQGNVTNTTTTTITTNITPITNNNTTNQVTVNQITNTTVTNANGEVQSTTETSEDPPPDEETTIEFDEVPDTDLQKQEIPLTLQPVSWGEGSCPADPVVSVMGASISIPVHIVCNYMSMVRPIVLAFFALISAYIIIGVRQEA